MLSPCSLWILLTAALAPQEAWSRAEMEADLRQLAAEVESEWSYLADRSASSGVDLDVLLQESIGALDGVATRAGFERVLRSFVAGLQDGHAGLELETGEPSAGYLLLELVDCAEGLVVSRAGEGFTVGEDAREPRRGDLLLAVDGRPVGELLAERTPLAFGSTPGQRRAGAIRSLLRSRSEEVEVELEDVAAERHRVRLRTRAWPLMDTSDDNWTLSWPREDMALLRISSFAVADWQAWLEAEPDEREPFVLDTYERIGALCAELGQRGARALLLDLRGNEGGTDLLGIRLAQHLLHEPFMYFRLSSLREDGWTEPGGLVYRTEQGMTQFHGPVVALIDAGCFSTTDNFLRCLRDLHPDFSAVGRPSAGGTGAPRTIATLAHSGARITLCTMRVHGPRSGLIEGRGTRPDVPVAWTRDDVIAGRDPDLAAALEHLVE